MKSNKIIFQFMGLTPHLLFIPMWLYFFAKMAEFYNLPKEQIGIGFSNNILFVFTLGYIAIAIYFTSLFQIFKAKGRPYWALALHILFPLFLIGLQLFVHGAAAGLKDFQL